MCSFKLFILFSLLAMVVVCVLLILAKMHLSLQEPSPHVDWQNTLANRALTIFVSSFVILIILIVVLGGVSRLGEVF